MSFSGSLLKLFKDIKNVFLERLLKLISPLIVSIIISRFVGVEQLGLYSLINSVYIVFVGISLLGFDSIIVRDLVKKENLHKIINNAYILKVLWSICISVFFIATCFLLDVENYGIYFLALSIFFLSFNVPEYYFQSSLSFDLLLRISFIIYPLGIIFKVYLIMVYKVIELKFIVDALESLLFCVLINYTYIKRSNIKLPRLHDFDRSECVRLLKMSAPLMLNTVVVILYFKADQIMLGKMLGLKELGLYSAGVQVSSIIGLFPSMVMGAIFPYMTKWTLNSSKNNNVVYLYQVFIAFYAVIAIPLFFLSEYVFKTLYGELFLTSSEVLKIHLIGFLFVYIGSISGSIIIIRNLEWLSAIRSIFSLLMNIILNYYFIPVYGIYGAAWATVITQLVSNYIFYLFIPKLRNEFYLVNKAVFLMPKGLYHVLFKLYSSYKRK
jgi:O-antigen/teichoic acid export membrane protein